MTKIARLSDRAAIRVGGADSAKFLQGLVTSDVTRVGPGAAIYTGLLTPQGKILFDFFLAHGDGGFLIDCARDAASDLVKRLTFYKLRAAVELTDLGDEKAIWAAWEGAPPEVEGAIAFADPRLPALGHRLIAARGADAQAWGVTIETEDAYHAHRIACAVPEGGRDFALGDTFPHEADLDQLGGIDFAKGCFVGQEVVSRMEHRGTARKRIVPVVGDQPLPPPGTEVTAGETTLGVLGSVTDAMGLALLRLDRAEKALSQDVTLKAGDVPIRLTRPDWASFDVPMSRDEDAA